MNQGTSCAIMSLMFPIFPEVAACLRSLAYAFILYSSNNTLPNIAVASGHAELQLLSNTARSLLT